MAKLRSSTRSQARALYGDQSSIPEPVYHEPTTGADLIDPNDPAIDHIKRAAMQLVMFGFEPNDPDITRRAIEAGRRDYDNDPVIREARRVEKIVRRRHNPSEVDEAEVVYYMRIGNRVKIGWSTNLPMRLTAINPEELMAVESGNRTLERSRHRQFSGLRTHGEWFRLEGKLADHIAELQRQATPS